MDPRESLRLSWRSIKGHRLRSILTTIGVVIGVAAVITFVALGASLQTAVVGDISADQTPAMTVITHPIGADGGFGAGSGQAVFTEHDIATVTALPAVTAVVEQGTVQLAAVRFSGQSIPLPTMVATPPTYFEYVATGTLTGSPYTPGTTEVVLNDVAADLFATNVTVGATITVTPSGRDPINATVVGILDTETRPFAGPSGTAQPLVYGSPDPFYQTRLESPTTGTQQRVYPRLTVVATDFTTVDTVADAVQSTLNTTGDARTLLPPSYEVSVVTNQEFIDQIQDILNTFTGFITGVAVISLVVGAIGIANIMLVSVTERTREIGIMKAVGFQNRDILQLFLVEATILGLIGSVGGIILGLAAGFGVTRYLDLPFTFPIEYAGIAVVVGILVGVVAGLYPAWDGARVDPIEALRYE
ncbi:MAG: ABC transporter permease [Halobacteriaceae archaeon]